jgi:hypothetical protein
MLCYAFEINTELTFPTETERYRRLVENTTNQY